MSCMYDACVGCAAAVAVAAAVDFVVVATRSSRRDS